MNNTCTKIFRDNNKIEYPCLHLRYKGTPYCVFHFDNIQDKKNDFLIALNGLIEANKDDSLKTLDLRGFIFPEFIFKRKIFQCSVDARKARFDGTINFEGTVFKKDVDFLCCEFNGDAIFQGTQFLSQANFMQCKFKEKAIFIGGCFKGRAIFQGCKYRQNAVFENRFFQKDVIFQTNSFTEDADFRRTHFFGKVDFTGTNFKKKSDFTDAVFKDEIKLNETDIAFLKGLPGSGVVFDGAILQTANFWQISRLKKYSFRNSFLIACNFARKEIIDCDFTGAVFKDVHTEGWMVDRKTLERTKYIYTDYKLDTTGEINVFKPIPESRQPVVGSFGDEHNPDFWMADYFIERHKWEYLFDFPDQIRTKIINYFQLFRDYVKATKDLEVAVATFPEGKKVRVSFIVEDESNREEIQKTLQEYIAFLFRPLGQINISLKENITGQSQNEFISKYFPTEIANMQNIFPYALKQQEERIRFAENLIMLFADKDKAENKLLIEKIGTQPPATAIATISDSAKVHSNIVVTVDLSKSFDDLIKEMEIGKVENREVIDELKNELALLSKEIIPGRAIDSSTKTKISKIQGVMSVLAKTGSFIISNADKIIILWEKIIKSLPNGLAG